MGVVKKDGTCACVLEGEREGHVCVRARVCTCVCACARACACTCAAHIPSPERVVVCCRKGTSVVGREPKNRVVKSQCLHRSGEVTDGFVKRRDHSLVHLGSCMFDTGDLLATCGVCAT